MISFILSEKVTYALGWVVFHSLWQAVLIAIVSGILLIVLRKKSSVVKYWLANFSLLSVLLAAIITFIIYSNHYQNTVDLSFTPVDYNASEVSKVVHDLNCEPTDFASIQSNGIQKLSWSGFKDYINRNIYLIVTFWLLGVSVFLIKLLGGISYIYYLKAKMNFPPDEYWTEMLEKIKSKAGIRKSIELVESALVRTPIVVGYLKPMILFPIGAINRLESDEVEAILAHELAHVMRNDYFFNILQNIIEALFYFHPAVWWMSAQIRAERENCCDDKAIELCGNSMTYAKSLIRVQEMAFYSPSLAMSFSGNKKGQLLNRVQRILNQPQNRNNVIEKLVATCLVLFFVIGLSIGGNFNQNNDNVYSNRMTDNELNNSEIDARSYLKYEETNGDLDSLPINSDIKDGVYDISDPLHILHLVVKDRSVVAFNLNGLDVPASKIKDFEKLIVNSFNKKKEYDEKPIDEYSKSTKSKESIGFTIDLKDIQNNSQPTSTVQSSWINTDKGDNSNSSIIFTNSDGYRYNFINNSNGEFVYVSKDNRNIGIINIKDNEYYINNKVATSSQLRDFGLIKSGNALNPIHGSFMTEDIKGNIDNGEFDKESYLEEVDNLQESINSVKNKGYNAKELNKIQKDLNQLTALINNATLKSEEDMVELQDKLDNISDNLAELDDNSKGSKGSKGSKNYDYGNFGDYNTNLKITVYQELIKDGLVKKEATYVSINNFNMMVNNQVVSKSLLEKYKKLCEKATGKPFEQTSYYSFSYYADDEEGASNNAYYKSNFYENDSKGATKEENAKPFAKFINMLFNDNKISLNNKVSLYIDNNQVKIDNMNVCAEYTERYIKNIEKLVKPNSKFSIKFNGHIYDVKKGGIKIDGTLNQSFDSKD